MISNSALRRQFHFHRYRSNLNLKVPVSQKPLDQPTVSGNSALSMKIHGGGEMSLVKQEAPWT